MKKKEQRKKIREERKKLNSIKANYNEDVLKIVWIGIIVVICFGVIYLGTAIYTGELSFGKKKADKKEVKIQNEERLAGETFEIKKEEYMMLYYDFKDKNLAIYEMINENYQGLGKDIPLYIVDLSSGFNKKYVRDSDEKYTTTPNDITGLKVKSPTLIRIKSGKVIKYIENSEDIIKYFED